MTEGNESTVLLTAVYGSKDDALSDLKAVGEAHRAELIGHFDAAVIDVEDGKPHIVKRLDRPSIRLIPEAFGGGRLPRKELHEAAQELTSGQAGLVVLGEPTLEKALDRAFSHAAKVAKHNFDAATDEIASELSEALKA